MNNQFVYYTAPVLNGVEQVHKEVEENGVKTMVPQYNRVLGKILHYGTLTQVMDDDNLGRYLDYRTVVYVQNIIENKIDMVDPFSIDFAGGFEGELYNKFLRELSDNNLLNDKIEKYLKRKIEEAMY